MNKLTLICVTEATVLRWVSPAPAEAGGCCHSLTPYAWAEKFESFERINSIRETNGNFDSCNSCKRLVPSRLHELHESKFPFVSRIEFIRSKLSNFSAHVYGVSDAVRPRPNHRAAPWLPTAALRPTHGLSVTIPSAAWRDWRPSWQTPDTWAEKFES